VHFPSGSRDAGKGRESMPADPVVYRIDLKVPDSLKAAITTVEGANRLVPAGTA
jgi:hypothetical protein